MWESVQEGGGLDAETIRQARAQQPSSGSIPVVVAGGDAAAVRGGGADGVAVRFDQLAPAAAALSGRPADTPAEQARPYVDARRDISLPGVPGVGLP